MVGENIRSIQNFQRPLFCDIDLLRGGWHRPVKSLGYITLHWISLQSRQQYLLIWKVGIYFCLPLHSMYNVHPNNQFSTGAISGFSSSCLLANLIMEYRNQAYKYHYTGIISTPQYMGQSTRVWTWDNMQSLCRKPQENITYIIKNFYKLLRKIFQYCTQRSKISRVPHKKGSRTSIFQRADKHFYNLPLASRVREPSPYRLLIVIL